MNDDQIERIGGAIHGKIAADRRAARMTIDALAAAVETLARMVRWYHAHHCYGAEFESCTACYDARAALAVLRES